MIPRLILLSGAVLLLVDVGTWLWWLSLRRTQRHEADCARFEAWASELAGWNRRETQPEILTGEVPEEDELGVWWPEAHEPEPALLFERLAYGDPVTLGFDWAPAWMSEQLVSP